jgi:hypothetical protein
MQHRLILLVFLAASSTASAQIDADQVYAGAGLSLAFEQFDLPRGVSADDTAALDLLAGYRVHPNVAMEGEMQLLYVPGFELHGIGGEVEGGAFTGSAKLFPVPPGADLQPFFLLGGGLLALDGPHRIDANKVNWMYQVGAGVDFPVADRTLFEVKATYRVPQGSLEDFEYWTVGANVQYRF